MCLRVASACTGAATEHIICQNIEKAFAAHGLEISFRQVFVCEIKANKRRFIKNVITDPDCCIFSDVRLLTEGMCDCDRHGRKRKVQDFDVWVSGFSCTSVSKQNMKVSRSDKAALLSKKDSCSTTVQTFYACLAMCAKHKPAIVTLENVDSLKDESASSSGQSNLDVVLQMFKEAGFDMHCYRMAATDYGLPQN